MSEDKIVKVLSKIYFDPSNPAGFASVAKLYKAGKRILPSLSIKDVKWFLRGHEAYTLHKPLKRKFLKRKTISAGLLYQYQVDLAVFEGISRYNSGYKFILFAIDIFSRKLHCELLKNKSADEVVKAFVKVFKKGVPKIVSSDSGTEFRNRKLQQYFAEKNVSFFTHLSDDKAAIAERSIRTVKEKLFRYFTKTNSLRYVEVLPNIVKAYNYSEHRSIKMKPACVNKNNEKQVWNYQYKDYLKKVDNREGFRAGDKVRLTKLKKSFRKGYMPKYTKEIFTVVDRTNTYPPVWRVMDQDANILKGVFYKEEMQLVRQ